MGKHFSHLIIWRCVNISKEFQINEQIRDIQNCYRVLFQSSMHYSKAIEHIEAELPASKERDEIILFVKNSQRGIIKGYQTDNKEEE